MRRQLIRNSRLRRWIPTRRGGEEHGTDADNDTTAETGEIPPEIADIDIDALDYNSDFTVFMKDNVPEIVRRRASAPVVAVQSGARECGRAE